MCLNMSPEMAFTVCLFPAASIMSTMRVIIVLPSAPSLLRACRSSVIRPEMLSERIIEQFLHRPRVPNRLRPPAHRPLQPWAPEHIHMPRAVSQQDRLHLPRDLLLN